MIGRLRTRSDVTDRLVLMGSLDQRRVEAARQLATRKPGESPALVSRAPSLPGFKLVSFG